MSIETLALLIGIATASIGSLIGFVAGIFGYDRRVDAKIAVAIQQIRSDILDPVVTRMDRMETRQIETNKLLTQLIMSMGNK